jgi:hypothetical protein
MLDTIIATHLSELRKRLDKAAEIARAADACATAGSIDAAVEVSFDVEQLIYEATTLLNATSLINRMREADKG